jgi:hypothetical protein
MKPGIKQHKPCRQAASIRLNAAHKHAFYAVRPEMIDQDYWRKIAMLDENTVSHDQTVVVRAGFPAELPLERCYRFIMAFNSRDCVKLAGELLDAYHDMVWNIEIGLNINDEQRLAVQF